MNQIAELRRSLREADTVFTVVKNTLASRRPSRPTGREALLQFLEGPTASRGSATTRRPWPRRSTEAARPTRTLAVKGGLHRTATT